MEYSHIVRTLEMYRGLIEFFEGSYYEGATEIYSDAIVTNGVVVRPQKVIGRRATKENVSKLNYMMNKLFIYIDKHFPVPAHNTQNNIDEVRAVARLFGTILPDDFHLMYEEGMGKRYLENIGRLQYGILNPEQTKDGVNQLWDVPPTLLETVIPIAIAKDIITMRKIPLDVTATIKVKNKDVSGWHLFSQRYSKLIMSF